MGPLGVPAFPRRKSTISMIVVSNLMQLLVSASFSPRSHESNGSQTAPNLVSQTSSCKRLPSRVIMCFWRRIQFCGNVQKYAQSASAASFKRVNEVQSRGVSQELFWRINERGSSVVNKISANTIACLSVFACTHLLRQCPQIFTHTGPA